MKITRFAVLAARFVSDGFIGEQITVPGSLTTFVDSERVEAPTAIAGMLAGVDQHPTHGRTVLRVMDGDGMHTADVRSDISVTLGTLPEVA